MRELEYVDTDYWDRPVYKDNTGKLWKDINLNNGILALHRSSNDELDGEPDYPISGEYKILTKPPVENPFKLQYQILSRDKSTCNYYLGYGNRSEHCLGGYSVTEFIDNMKNQWNAFPEDAKPEWLTWEDILEYENEMLNGTKQRYKQDGQWVYFEFGKE